MHAWHIARRLFHQFGDEQRVSRAVVTIATVGVAVGVCVMILCVCITSGFQHEIRNKVIGFSSHIRIINSEGLYNSMEGHPIVLNDSLVKQVQQTRGIKHTQRFVQKAGMIKTEENFHGVSLQGVASDYDTLFLAQHLTEGRMPRFSDSKSSNEVLISSRIANKLNVHLHDQVTTYFFENKVRARRFTIVGIYNTNLTDFDNNVIFTDLYAVQKLWGWDANQYSGLEASLYNFDQLVSISLNLSQLLRNQQGRNDARLVATPITDLYPQIFSWLDLLNTNVWVILILMLCVAGFTMISGLLIIILERTAFIGIMKAMGASNAFVRKIFLSFSWMILFRGLLWGNLVAFALMFLHQAYPIIHLNPQDYYMDTIPLFYHWGYILGISLFTWITGTLAFMLPSFIISKISPARSIQFE